MKESFEVNTCKLSIKKIEGKYTKDVTSETWLL